MKSLIEYMQNHLRESLLDVDDTNDDDLKQYAAKWISENNTFQIDIDPSSITIKNGKVDVKHEHSGERLEIALGNGKPEQIPFKLGKFEGFISANYIKNMDGSNLPDECYGLSFIAVNKLNLKNAHIKINKYPKEGSMSNCIDVYNSPNLFKSVRNVKFEFAGAGNAGRLRINKLKQDSLNNIELINCKEIYITMSLYDKYSKMTRDDFKKLLNDKNVGRLNYFGNIITK